MAGNHYQAFQTNPNLLSPIIRLISILIQSNSTLIDNSKQSNLAIDDFEPKVLIALYETLYTYIVNILQVN